MRRRRAGGDAAELTALMLRDAYRRRRGGGVWFLHEELLLLLLSLALAVVVLSGTRSPVGGRARRMYPSRCSSQIMLSGCSCWCSCWARSRRATGDARATQDEGSGGTMRCPSLHRRLYFGYHSSGLSVRPRMRRVKTAGPCDNEVEPLVPACARNTARSSRGKEMVAG
ncbi:hypothetical protein B0H16DRAFT_1530156 [Mycena metata]|uniref:Uncharacterized protein n=1 Tax=Mycena metata TaxID=1033252 RepID=A0AAD7NIT5_9AGAR|nr:hypothetical protein B0H16DRAFT_1530156 [Mycena metata]